jgi:hypothetical protein
VGCDETNKLLRASAKSSSVGNRRVSFPGAKSYVTQDIKWSAKGEEDVKWLVTLRKFASATKGVVGGRDVRGKRESLPGGR